MSKFQNRSYINVLMLLRVVGWLLMIEAAFMLVPMCVGFYYGDSSGLDFLLSFGITALSGTCMMCLRPKSREMGKREAILLVAMIWIIFSMFGMLPFIFFGTHLSVTDAFFETMSGFTTTGATVLNSVVDVPRAILLWRCEIQWIGGLGIILFTLAVLPMLNYQGGMQLFNAEVTGITHDKLRPRVSSTAKGLWLVYIALTVLLTVLLCLSDMSGFDAVCHGLSTMSTGGFSTNDMNIRAWNSPYIKIVVSVFMFLGGVNFALIYNLVTGRSWNLFKNDAFKWYLIVTFSAYVILAVNVASRGLMHNISDVTIDPLFQAVSILSSTGLTEPDFEQWGPIAVIMLIIMMMLGACAGSTSGGAKLDRFIVLMKFLKNEFYKIMHPNAVTTVCVNGKGMPYVVVQKVLAFLFLYVMVILVGAIMLVLLGFPLRDSLFCCLSAISNTGLGTAATGLGGSYAMIPDMAKWILAFIMLVGRLELYTILLLFTVSFWKK